MPRILATRAQQATIIRTFGRMFGSPSTAALGRMKHVDRVYELHCLISLLDGLKRKRPAVHFVLAGGSGVALRASGGAIDRTSHAYIEVQDGSGRAIAELWSNVEFWALSHVKGRHPNPRGWPRGAAHELDLVLLTPGVSGRPEPADILIGVEAKHRPYGKGLLKELLGVRREMTYVGLPQQNPWVWWGAPSGLPARPPSGMIAWCPYPSILDYDQAADFYGILMDQLPL